jgi:2-C-methyl-D-erythritol 4-phosphate cytidylyltransferase
VLVHDAARPFVDGGVVDAVIATAAEGTGAVPAVPVTDTLKQADAAGVEIVATVPRTSLWRAQTPQGFPRAMLETAYARWAQGGTTEATDDAAVVQAGGFPVRLVPDGTTNLKVTTPEDFLLAEALARR